MMLIGGIEGGASSSRVVLVDETGRLVGHAEGMGSNPWLIGTDKVIPLLVNMIHKALETAGLPPSTKLNHLGLCLSGVDTDETSKEFIDVLVKCEPKISDSFYVCNDSIGTGLTVTDGPVLVLIAGTGSICNYVRPDLTFERIGGYGYFLGDGGSGYWISMRVITTFLEIEDGMLDWSHDLTAVRMLLLSYFELENTLGLLDYFYNHFTKAKVAGLCVHLAALARSGDVLCLDVFRRGGIELARHTRSGINSAARDMTVPVQELLVLCCGSVFNSWDLLQSGFKDYFNSTDCVVNWGGYLDLVRLKVTAAHGAARLAARVNGQLNIPLPSAATVSLDRVKVCNSSR